MDIQTVKQARDIAKMLTDWADASERLVKELYPKTSRRKRVLTPLTESDAPKRKRPYKKRNAKYWSSEVGKWRKKK
jgi:hypothetical protein